MLFVGEEGDTFLVLKFSFCIYVLVYLGYVQTVRPRRASGLPVILHLDSHTRVRFGLVLLAPSYVPWFLQKWYPGGGTDRSLQNAPSGPSSQADISASAKHTLSGHVKTWSLYNWWYFFSGFSDLYFSQSKTEVCIKCAIFYRRFQLSILNIKACKINLYFNTEYLRFCNSVNLGLSISWFVSISCKKAQPY